MQDGRIQKFRDWWRSEPAVADEDLPLIHPDARLADAMRAEAEVMAGTDPRLDFSVASLAVIDVWIAERHPVVARAAGAYVGEVVIRNGVKIYWSRAGRERRNAGVAIGKWLADPFERVAAAIDGSWTGDETLIQYVQWLLLYESDSDTAIAKIGLTTRLIGDTAAEGCAGRWKRWRRRHP